MTASKLRPEQRYAQEARGTLDDMLDLIDGIKLKAAPWEQGGRRVPEARFNRAVLFSDMLNEVSSGDLFYAGSDVFDLWPVHSRATVRCDDADSNAFVLLALDSITPRETRGRVKRPMRRMLRYSNARVQRDGHGLSVEVFYGVKPDGSLVDITNVDGGAYPVPAHEQEKARLLAGQSLHMQYQWTVDVRAVGSNFTLRVPTTPTGARKLLSLRDVEAGRERRRALKHWVNAHTRRVAGRNSEKEVDIPAHLRGVTPFKWDDLEGVVRPSPHDLKAASA
jgi:hypothetical protein